jgi:hypothetical protein
MKNFQYILTYNDLGYSETLRHNPIGWNNLGLTFMRNEVYNSILRSFSLSLRFPRKSGAGGSEIEESYLLKGISASIDIEVKELDTATETYTTIYTGIIDFAPERFTRERDWIEAGIIDTGKLQKLKAREDIDYDLNSTTSTDDVAIDPFVSAPRDIIFRKIDIYLQVAGKLSGFSIIGTGGYFELSGDPPSTIESGLYVEFQEDLTVQELGDRFGLNDVYEYAQRERKLYTNDLDEATTIIINSIGVATGWDGLRHTATGGTYEAYFRLYLTSYDEDDNVLVEQVILEKYWLDVFESDVAFTMDVQAFTDEISIPAGGYLEIYYAHEPTTIWVNATAEVHGFHAIEIDFHEKTDGEPDTAVQCFLPHEAFTRLIQLITSETNTANLFYSEYLGRTDSEFTTYATNGAGAFDAIASGWNLRGFPDQAFNVNIKDLFESFGRIHALGMGYDRVNDRFYISPIEEFYDASYFMFDLGEVAELSIKPHKEIFHSKIDSGYDEKGEYENLQGVNEFNLSSEHSEVLPVKSTNPLRPVYNADSIGMELARRAQYYSSASEDTKYDDNIYIVHTDGSYTLVAAGATGFRGIEQYYNIALTPRENIIRNAGLIKSGLWLHDLKVKFVKAQKDKDITYVNQNGNSVSEFDDLDGTDLVKSQLFIPEVYEFESKITPEIFTILNTNPHGYIRFSFNETEYEGFLLSVESGEYNGRKANYRLIAKTVTVGDNKVFEDEDNMVFEDGNNYVFE